MELWLAIAVFCAAVIWLLLMAAQQSSGLSDDKDAVLNALRAELDEVKRDEAANLIDAGNAKLARAEIGRRLFQIEDQLSEPTGTDNSTRRRFISGILYVSLALIPILSIGFYLTLGTVDYPDQPMSARLQGPTQNQSIPTLIARVEKHLKDNPQDANGWKLLAPVYRRLGQNSKAVDAYARALRFGRFPPAEESALLADLGELVVVQADGVVSPAAFRNFMKAGDLDAKNGKAAFFIALHTEQQGNKEQSIAAWQEVLKRFRGEDQAWLEVARQRLAAVQNASSQPGPSAEDVEAAQSMSGSDRKEMIEGMVARLAEKLDEEPGDADGWLRLIRSYMVLGKKDEAFKALQRARTEFATDNNQLERLTTLANELKLDKAVEN